MKKKLVSLLLCSALVATTFAGCGKSDKNDTQGATDTKDTAKTDDAIANLIASTDKPVDLTLWCSETKEYQTVMAELVEDFKKQYPDVTFNITIGAESEANCRDDVLKDPEAAADVFVFPDDQLYDLVNANALQSLDTSYTYDPHEANAEQTVAAATMNGKLYAYPLTASNGYFLFYNKKYLSEEDVKSWDSILKVAEENKKTVGMEVSGAWYLYGFFAGAGLEMKSEDGIKNTCNWNATDTEITGAQVATAIAQICKSPAMKNCVNEDAQSFAKDGEMIADVNGTWATNAFKEAYGDDYAAAKLPTFTVDGKQIQMGSFAGYKFMGVNSYSKNAGWAMLLAEFLTSETSQTKIALATGEGPSNLVAASSDSIASAPALHALSEQAEFADLQRVGDNYWNSAATLGQTLADGSYDDIQKALDLAVEGITQ
ncbi:extracellular solute-binding protein [Agathobacter ruminis]|uniref:Sugar ABC transporter substrate-binding protein n=1 Tax=Agathobacter ruminis TaxID=1712665 RepID=A0A2G3E3X3_9FIRM|nr:extracellular solute-binding protein [Agathobacter ruminis]MDC7301780.1 extracellular solute-binding protein [Agathobacter ruminis]PHU37997.1 sugar ABC transporter substrate-binding protein [Agathobacter ruminis]